VNGEIPFYKTAMGRDFYDRNMPMLVKQLARLNDNLEKLIKQNEPKPKEELPYAEPRDDGGR